MKKIVIIVIVFVLSGCQQYKKEVARLQAVQDSLAVASHEKDSTILGFLADFNDIQATLDSMKKVEKLVVVDKVSGVEISSNRKKQIVEDIGKLREMLEKNKSRIASLQKKLRNSRYKVGKMEKMIAEFEVMVTNLTAKIKEKDTEIAQLNKDLRKLHLDIDLMFKQIEEVKEESAQKTATIENQFAELNKAYYAFGTAKELEQNNVVDREGGFLGIGRTLKIKKDFNRDYFTQIDIRKFKYLPLMVKKAKVLSVHPVTSYHITGEKTADTLFIDNYQEFWKASKYLLVVSE
ncbi:hypothetical protein MNBD_BACTEROID01-1906 [hydrothermal vent metagenome]|uniref:Lipoprotein n=1 Tax=hydrothermal vent metagenome TaxID=652676 RepID=A0A3B0TQB3_9ZZZZ